MNKYAFILSFKIPELNKFTIGFRSKPVNRFFKATLEASENSLEISIPYETSSYLGIKFFQWSRSYQKKNLGYYLQANQENQNPRLRYLDFSKSIMVGAKDSGLVGTMSELRLKLDQVRMVWDPEEEYTNTSEIYLNNAGFRFTSEFYSPLFYDWENDDFSAKKYHDDWYSMRTFQYQPKHNYVFGDKIENEKIHIRKEPYIEIKGYTCQEEELMQEITMICDLVSFYFHEPIQYVLLRLRFPEYTVTIKQLRRDSLKSRTNGFLYINYAKRIHYFLREVNLDFFYKEPETAQHIIEKFILSAQLRGTSRFLLLYNLLEIIRNKFPASNGKITKHKLVVSRKAFQKKWKEAEELILQSFEETSHEEIRNKLSNFKGHLPKRNINNPIRELLTFCDFPLDQFPIRIEELTRLRSDIIHGSLVSALDTEHVEKANHILYQTVAILMLRLLEIDGPSLMIDPKYQ